MATLQARVLLWAIAGILLLAGSQANVAQLQQPAECCGELLRDSEAVRSALDFHHRLHHGMLRRPENELLRVEDCR